MINPDDLYNRRSREMERNNKIESKEKTTIELKQNEMLEGFKNLIYTPAFLKEQIGKLMKIEFLIGTNNLVNKIGFLEDVEKNYILLRSLEGDSLIYADICAIKFITISVSFAGIPNFQSFTNSMNMQNMNMGVNSNVNKYY